MSVPPPPPPPPPPPGGPQASGTPPLSSTPAPVAYSGAGNIPPPPPGFPAFGGLPPLPAGWTEHHATGGALYWYNASTGQSTYQRPLPHMPIPFPPPNFAVPPPGYPAFPPGSSSDAAPAGKEKKKKKEKAKDKLPVPGTSWIRVKTSEGNTFYMNKETKQSEWTVPDEIKSEVADLEAQERAAADALRAEEETSAKVELERLKAEIAAQKAAAEEVASRKRKLPPPTEPAAMKSARAKIDPPPAAPARPPTDAPKQEQMEDDEELDIDALSAMHNQLPDEVSHAAAPEDDAEEDGLLGPSGPEEEEAWQRQIAAEMGIEYVSPEDREARERSDKANAKKAEAEAKALAREEAGRSVFGQAPVGGRVEISLEEGKALFKSLLYEKNISPVAPWDFSLPLFINDPRYILLSSMNDRQEVFEEYCRDKARELRQAKQAAASAGPVEKKSPEEEYQALLRKEVTSTRTRFDDFRRTWKKDRRFFAFGRDDREREKAFKSWLRELGEGKRAAAKKAESDFIELLKVAQGLTPDTQWKDVKVTFEKDPRYDAVGSSSVREEIFNKFIKSHNIKSHNSTSAGPSDAIPDEDPAARKAREKKERAEASLREREENVRAQQRKVGQEMQRSRGMAGREEAEREFGTLLVDQVREHDASWGAYLPMLEKDPRFQSPSLFLGDKHRLFTAHLDRLHQKRLSALHALFQANSPSLATAFSDVYAKVSDDFAVTRLHLDPEALEDEYVRWQRQQNDDARRAFSELLKENAFFTFWAGQKKAEQRDKEKGFGMEDEDSDDEGEGGGGKANLKDMANQIDMKEVESVLKQDRRYQVFDHIPEEREKWIREHMDTISAPALSVHVNL